MTRHKIWHFMGHVYYTPNAITLYCQFVKDVKHFMEWGINLYKYFIKKSSKLKFSLDKSMTSYSVIHYPFP